MREMANSGSHKKWIVKQYVWWVGCVMYVCVCLQCSGIVDWALGRASGL